MHDLRIWRDHRAIAQRRRTEAHVYFFAIHEVAGIEPAQLPLERSRNHEETSLNDIHLPHSIAFPPADRFRVKQSCPREYHAQTREGTKETPWSHLVPAGLEIQRPVRKNCSATGNARFQVLFCKRRQIVDGLRVNFRIRIQQQDPLAVDQLYCLIVRAREAKIPEVPNQIDLREPLGDHVSRPVLGMIISDNYPHPQVRRIVKQGFQTAQG
jgi:hypothetical protein